MSIHESILEHLHQKYESLGHDEGIMMLLNGISVKLTFQKWDKVDETISEKEVSKVGGFFAIFDRYKKQDF